MISEYLVAVWSHSHRWGNSSVKYYECSTHDEAQTFAKREAEYLDTIGREYSINIYVNEEITRCKELNASKEITDDGGKWVPEGGRYIWKV